MYLVHLKTFLRNRAQPEGSIAEGYILEVTITFCSRYLEGVDHVATMMIMKMDLVICSMLVVDQLGR